MSDLVKRARRLDTCIFPTERSKCLCGELADHIEKLEAALKHCINALKQYEMGDNRPRGPIPNDDLRPWLLGAMDYAIQTLEGKDD